MKEYAIKGLKQLKIEFYSSIVSLPISFFFYTIFFITSKVRPMVIGCIFLGVTFILFFMKPLIRKSILRDFKDGLYWKEIFTRKHFQVNKYSLVRCICLV